MSTSNSPQGNTVSSMGDHAQGPPRKKMRKGTKSCIECRRRKIKCTFEPDRPSICNECFARGSTCIDQEHGDVNSLPTPQPNDQNSNLKDRVSLLEDMLKQVLDRLPERGQTDASPAQTEQQADTQAAEVLKSLRTPVRAAQLLSDESHLLPSDVGNEAPALSLFDNAVIQRKEVPTTVTRAQYNKSKTVIAALMQLLPSPQDLEIILENSQEWWAIWRTMFPEITDRRCVTIKESVSHSLRSQKPAEIAKIMLCIALSINQLPHDFDWNLVSIKESPSELMERYISTVDRLITSDDDIAATVDGLECMILESKYYINLGKPRRSWLLYHRAIAFAQLLGLQRLPLKKPPNPDQEYYRQLMVWTHLVLGDRYLSLVLGLPYCVPDAFCVDALAEAAAIARDTAKGEAYLASMAPIMTKLIDRNQSTTTAPYSVTLALEQQIEELKRKTSPDWWTTAKLPGSTIEEHFDKLQAQFFHHHARVLMHMPFMLRSSSDKLYQYSHTAALESAREMIRYFDALRGAENVGPHICKLLDFQAFTGAMILLLNLCGYNSHIRGALPQQPDLDQDQQDSALIDRTITLLREAANEPGGVVASQCAKALDMLGMIRTGKCANGEDVNHAKKGESCQISIPYFGTISISAGKHFVPIKPGTYPEAGTVRKSIAAPHRALPQNGMPTPPSMCSGSSQASPNITLDPSPFMPSSDYSSNVDNSWTASTEDPFITFDSFMAFPGAQNIDFGGPNTASSDSSAYAQHQSFGGFGTIQEQNLAAGFPFPAVSGGNLELDNGWNWFGVDAPVL